LNRSPVRTRPKTHGSMPGLGNNPAKTKQVGFLAGCGTEPNRTEPNRTEPNRTEPNRTEPNRTERPGKNRTAGWLPGPVANTRHKRTLCTGQFTIPVTASMSHGPSCNNTDTSSSHPNQASCTPAFSYPLTSSTSFSCSSLIFQSHPLLNHCHTRNS